MATRTASRTRDAQLDLATAQLAGGTLRIYAGAQPASPDAPTGSAPLVTLGLSSPAFAPANSGRAVAATISPGTVHVVGEAGWFQLVTAGGVAIYDGAIPAELQLEQLRLALGAELIVDSLTVTIST